MKTKLYKIAFATLICTYLLSCKKNHTTAPDNSNKKYNLHVNIADFSQTISGNSFQGSNLKTLSSVSAPSSLASLVKNLWIIVYDSQKKQYIGNNVLNTDVNFGTFNVQLIPGTYQVCVVGYNGPAISVNTTQFTAYTKSQIVRNPFSNVSNLNISQWTHFYSYSQPLTIVDADVNKDITLTRLTSQLVLNITDAIPSSVYSIQFAPSYNFVTYNYYDNKILPNTVATGVGVLPVPLTDTIPAAAKGKTGYQMVYNLLMDTTISVNVTAYNATAGIVAQRTINNIRVKPNSQVTLSGNMFGGTTANGSGNSFKISIDTAWSQTGNLTQTFSSQNKKAAQ